MRCLPCTPQWTSSLLQLKWRLEDLNEFWSPKTSALRCPQCSKMHIVQCTVYGKGKLKWKAAWQWCSRWRQVGSQCEDFPLTVTSKTSRRHPGRAPRPPRPQPALRQILALFNIIALDKFLAARKSQLVTCKPSLRINLQIFASYKPYNYFHDRTKSSKMFLWTKMTQNRDIVRTKSLIAILF